MAHFPGTNQQLRPIFYREWEHRGIRKIKYLKDTNNNFLSLQELQKKYGFKNKPLKYFVLISVLKSLWETSNRSDLTNNSKEYESLSTKLINVKNRVEPCMRDSYSDESLYPYPQPTQMA